MKDNTFFIESYLPEIVDLYAFDLFRSRLNIEFMLKNSEKPYGHLISESLFNIACIHYTKVFLYQEYRVENIQRVIKYKLEEKLEFFDVDEKRLHDHIKINRNVAIAHTSVKRFDRTNSTQAIDFNQPYLCKVVHKEENDKNIFPKKNKYERIDSNIIFDDRQYLLKYNQEDLSKISRMIVKLQERIYENGLLVKEQKDNRLTLSLIAL